MKARILHTQFWTDDFVTSQPKDVRLLYNYLLTNPYIGLTGIYRLPLLHSRIETGLNEEEMASAFKTLETNKKAFYYKGWVYIPKSEEYNKFSVGSKTGKGFQNELNDVPQDVFSYFNKIYPYHTPMIPLENRKQKTETINKKTEIRKELRKEEEEIMNLLTKQQ